MHEPRRNPLRAQRLTILTALVLIGFGLVVIGLVRLQVAGHERYKTLSLTNHVRLEVMRAPRGAIYDRHGVLLADSGPSFRIMFTPFPAESVRVAKVVASAEWLERVASVVELEPAEIEKRMASANATGRSAVLRRNAPMAVRAAVEETLDELPGIEIQIEPIRRYPFGEAAAHILGYAGEVNDRELDTLGVRGYGSGDLIGRTGIERSYEAILRGANGAEFVVVNASGKRVSTFGDVPPRLPSAGHDLVLTLDIEVQLALEEAMADVARGAAVALDPRDGGILGLVSRPTFDPNEFSVGITSERWRALTSGGSNPFLNRAIQGQYPPGSTFKIVTMLAALASGTVRPEQRFSPCGGSYVYGGRRFGCWKREGHGSLDFVGALQHSCDVYFYQVGPRLGLARLGAYAHDFGLGERTGIDLPQEKGGLVPDAEYYGRHGGKPFSGVMLNLAIGQGELLVTPLQLALMAAEAVVGGRALRPHAVHNVRGEAGYRPPRPTHPSIDANAETWKAVRTALELTVAEGTGTAARVQGVRVGGKTGTAQNPHGEDHALFVCVAPMDDPQIAIAVVVENAGHGGSQAAPRAGQALRRILLPDSLRAPARPAPPRGAARESARAEATD